MEVFLKRLYALIIDYAIVYVPSFLLGWVLKDFLVGFENKFLLWLREYFIFILIFIIYTFFMEYKYRNTVGKNYLRLKVVYDKKNLLNILIRAFIKAISITAFYGSISVLSGIIMILFNPEMSIHDYIVGSKVCIK